MGAANRLTLISRGVTLAALLAAPLNMAAASQDDHFAALPDPRKMTVVIEKSIRLEHAHELMGKHYRKSVVRNGEDIEDLDSYVRNWTANGLKGKWKAQAAKVAQTVMEEGRKYQLDPVFILAIISAESSFNPIVRGPAGEIGLMQLRPTTAAWIAKKTNIPWKGPLSLNDPVVNIRIGAAYVAWLRDEFESHSRLYLAAYNMGVRNVHKALEKQIWPKDYPQRVMSKYVAYYASLHEHRHPHISRSHKAVNRLVARGL